MPSIKMPGVPTTRRNQPRRIGSGGLKFVTECKEYFGFGDTRQESFKAWQEARDSAKQK